MLVEAAWAASKAPGPLRAFFLRIRARRGHQIAAVAVARKLTVLCWHLLTKDADYQWARPALVANKLRAMELQAGQPVRKGNKRGPAYAYNIKELRDREIESPAMPNTPTNGSSADGSGAAMGSSARVPQARNDADEGARSGLHPRSRLFATRSTRAGPG